MKKADADTLLFFAGHEGALPLYFALEEWIFRVFPGTEKRVRGTQISFADRCVFACVSFARVKRKAELPAVFLTLTLGLPAPLDSGRIAVRTEPYPGRWTHHIVIGRPGDLDSELLSWISLARDFALTKHAKNSKKRSGAES